MIVLHEGIHNIFQNSVVRVGTFDSYDLPKFIFERFLAFGFHLLLGKGFLIGAVIKIMIVIILTHRVSKSTFLTLLTQVLTHIIKISLVAAESLACDGVAVADKKMCVRVGLVDMYSKQHLVALKKLFCKVFRNLENFLVGEFAPVLRRE